MIVQIIADSPESDTSRVDKTLPIICLDGAIYRLLELGITPQYLIGDLDAADEAVLNRAKNLGVKVIQEQDQNSSDLEKGIHLATSLGATDIRIFQALGGRADHTLHNLGLLKKFRALKLSIINQDETITYVENTSFTLEGQPLTHIAIMGFPEAMVTSVGLQYDMDNLSLKIGGQQSSSNKLNGVKASVRIEGEAVLIRGSERNL